MKYEQKRFSVGSRRAYADAYDRWFGPRPADAEEPPLDDGPLPQPDGDPRPAA